MLRDLNNYTVHPYDCQRPTDGGFIISHLFTFIFQKSDLQKCTSVVLIAVPPCDHKRPTGRSLLKADKAESPPDQARVPWTPQPKVYYDVTVRLFNVLPSKRENHGRSNIKSTTTSLTFKSFIFTRSDSKVFSIKQITLRQFDLWGEKTKDFKNTKTPCFCGLVKICHPRLL